MARKKPDEEVVYTKPTAQVDLEERLARDNESPLAIVKAVNNHDPFGVEEEAYVNVDPVYQNYADDTHKPLEAEEGVNKDAEEAFKEAVAAGETDYSNDQKPSGAYVDSSDQGSAGAGSSGQSKADEAANADGSGDAPFGGDNTDESK